MRHCSECGSFLKKQAVNCKPCLRTGPPVIAAAPRKVAPAPSIPILLQAPAPKPYFTVRGWLDRATNEKRARQAF